MSGVLHHVVLAVVGDQAALPHLADHRDGLLQHVEPGVHWRPVVAQNVLVQGLPGAHAESEAAAHQLLTGSRGLRDDHRMQAYRPTRHRGLEPQVAGRPGNAANHGPDKRGMALLVEPGVEVVGDPRGTEAGLLRPRRRGSPGSRGVLRWTGSGQCSPCRSSFPVEPGSDAPFGQDIRRNRSRSGVG
jgi:hypothetical protein